MTDAFPSTLMVFAREKSAEGWYPTDAARNAGRSRTAWNRLFAHSQAMPSTLPIACHDRPTSRAAITDSSSACSAARARTCATAIRESRIVDRHQRIWSLATIGVLDLVQHLFDSPHGSVLPWKPHTHDHGMTARGLVSPVRVTTLTDEPGGKHQPIGWQASLSGLKCQPVMRPDAGRTPRGRVARSCRVGRRRARGFPRR